MDCVEGTRVKTGSGLRSQGLREEGMMAVNHLRNGHIWVGPLLKHLGMKT